MPDTSISLQDPAPLAGRYDVVVVGARVAGAATAMLLAQRGLRVLVVDRAGYGSDTLSSHALMRGAVRRLHAWGLLDRVWAAGTPVVTRTTFGYGERHLAFEGLGDDLVPGLAAPRRTVLDRILVDAAVAAGATVRHGTRLVAIDTGRDGRVRSVALGAVDGTTKVVGTDLVVGADGLRSTVARLLDVPITRQGDAAVAYVLRYVTGVDLSSDTYRWRYGRELGAGVIPTNDDAFCVFAALPPHRFRHEARSDPATTMAHVLSMLDSDLAHTLDAGTAVGPVRTWPGALGQFRRAQGPGWALVGDAGYFKDPFAAHGISDALRDAELLAEAVLDGTMSCYEQRRDELSLPLFEVLERIARFDWDLDTLPALHIELANAMRAEERAQNAWSALR